MILPEQPSPQACQNQDKDMIRLLLENEKIEISTDFEQAQNPLIIAINSGNLSIVKLLSESIQEKSIHIEDNKKMLLTHAATNSTELIKNYINLTYEVTHNFMDSFIINDYTL